jgi:hypothetical protein
MHRRTFLVSGPAAAAAGGFSVSAWAKPGAPSPSTSSAIPDSAVVPNPHAQIVVGEPPPASVILSPFEMMQGGVGLSARPDTVRNTPQGGTLLFKGSQNLLTLLYPTPAMTMTGQRLEVRVGGLLFAEMKIHVQAVVTSDDGKDTVKKQYVVHQVPQDQAIEFTVKTDMLTAGNLLKIHVSSTSTDVWAMFHSKFNRVDNPKPRRGTAKRRTPIAPPR